MLTRLPATSTPDADFDQRGVAVPPVGARDGSHGHPEGADLARDIHVRPGVGVAADVLQGRGLEMLRMRVDLPALIVVDRGIKTITPRHGVPVRAAPGQAILVDGNQTVDFFNSVADGTHYAARWLLFDASLVDDAYYIDRAARLAPEHRDAQSLRLIARVHPGLSDAFERARHALTPRQELPHAVARQRVLEVLHWLLEDGVIVRSVPLKSSTSLQVRSLIAGRLGTDWTADRVCSELALSEATLRRRLVAEGTSLKALLVDARMSSALTLLQATARPVSDIALAVGYESSSRFAIRFRQRFGFAPTDVRGHRRADPRTDPPLTASSQAPDQGSAAATHRRQHHVQSRHDREQRS